MDGKLAEKRVEAAVPNDTAFCPFQDDIPGPGFYNVIHQSPVFNSVSLSNRGTCMFPSTVRAPGC